MKIFSSIFKVQILVSVVFFFIIIFSCNLNATQLNIQDDDEQKPLAAYLISNSIVKTAEADSYTSFYSPDSNYGNVSALFLTNNSGYTLNQCYLRFNFTDRPSSWKEAIIELYFFGTNPGDIVDIYQVTQNWDEMSIIYSDSPSIGNKIGELVLNNSGQYSFDVTNFITSENTNLSILVTPRGQMPQSWEIMSKESDYTPKIVWTYDVDVGFTITAPLTGVEFKEGDFVNITWNTNTAAGYDGQIYVSLELYKGNTKVGTISSEIVNNGKFDWQIPKSYESGSDYRIKITDTQNNSIYAYSGDFKISQESAESNTNNKSIPGYPAMFICSVMIGSIFILIRMNRKKLE